MYTLKFGGLGLEKNVNLGDFENSGFEFESEPSFFKKEGNTLEQLRKFEEMYYNTLRMLKDEGNELENRKKIAYDLLKSKEKIDEDNINLNDEISNFKSAACDIHEKSLDDIRKSLSNQKSYVRDLEVSNERRRSLLSESKSESVHVLSKFNTISPHVEDMFYSNISSVSSEETDHGINQILKYVREKKQIIKKEKEEVKEILSKIQSIRDRSYDSMELKLANIDHLQRYCNDQEVMINDINTLKQKIDEAKNVLSELLSRRDEMERQNYTVLRDKGYNSTLLERLADIKRDISSKKNILSTHKTEVENGRDKLRRKREKAKKCELYVKAHEERVERLEKSIQKRRGNVQTEIIKTKDERSKIDKVTRNLSMELPDSKLDKQIYRFLNLTDNLNVF